MAGIKEKIDFEGRRKQGYDYYISQGLSPIQASALIGNFIQESNLNPLAVGDDGKSRGVAQWQKDRLQRLRDINGGENSQNYGNQLNFALQELQTTHKKAFQRLKNAKTIEEATLAISDEYERPNKKYASNDKRIQYALDTHNKFNTPISFQQQEAPIGSIYQTQVAPYINVTQNITSLDNSAVNTNLATEEQEEEEPIDPEVEQAKEKLSQQQMAENFFTKYFEAANAMQAPPEQIEEVEAPIQVKPFGENILNKYAQIENFIGTPEMQQGGVIGYSDAIINDNLGQWINKGAITQIQSGDITTYPNPYTGKPITQNLLGVDEFGNIKLMKPNNTYKFPGNTVTEFPLQK